MIDSGNPIWLTLDYDQHNLDPSKRILEEHGLLELFERVPGLFSTLPREIEAALRDSGRNPYVHTGASGDRDEAWDFILRVFMVQSARMQFLHAMGHLLRGHSLELFGHVRTMVENAGIAYLSKSEPDLGKLYLDGDSAYKDRTASSKILPKSDPLTADLNEAFSIASSIFHSNFVAIASLIQTDFQQNAGRIDFESQMRFHDVDPANPSWFLRHAGWLLRQCMRVLRLFGSAFGLPDCVWYRRLEHFDRDAQVALEALRPLVYPGRAEYPPSP